MEYGSGFEDDDDDDDDDETIPRSNTSTFNFAHHSINIISIHAYTGG